MSKLDALKEKLDGLRTQLREKTDKIAFIRSWRENRAKKLAAPPKPEDPHSLSAIYREGGTGTRLQVLAFYLFLVVAIVSAGSLIKKMAGKMQNSAAHEKMVTDFSHELAESKRKHEEDAQLLSLGQFTTNIYVGPPEESKMMSIDLWIRVSDPQTAGIVNDRNEVFREKTIDALNSLFQEKVNLLQEEGKKAARERVREALNTALKAGKVEEVFIQNLIVQ
ncbi:MAG: flagellar basal body-associated FliL family protein [Bdellovibrionota bacterium]